jgi:hypothetical protein
MANATPTLVISLSLGLSLLALACNPGTEPAATTGSPPVEAPPKSAVEPSAEPTAVEPTSVEAAPTRAGAPMLGTSLSSVRQPRECRPPVTTNECPPGRLVGRFAGACPDVYAGDPPPSGPRWNIEPMFVLGSNHYCRYVWTGDPNTPAPLPNALQKQLGPDCRVYVQSPIDATLSSAYERAFAEGTQPLLGPPGGGHPVMIAVVDTAPAQTSMGQSEHGRAIAAIIGKLAAGCVTGLGEADCPRKIITELGLPQTRTGVDATHGGYFGYQSELAQGIFAALARVPIDDRKLVLNLAVGWEPKPDELTSPTPAVQAVRDMIAVAHCRGAAIIVASGNQPPGGPCARQGTAPGTWASQPGWTAAQCSALGLVGNQINLPSPQHAYHPFLHAATPLGWDAGNLADFRPGSNARIATIGFAGATTLRGESYGPMTGSSVSTAALSGIASLVWSYFPNLGADALMQLIYDSGTSTLQTASLTLPQPSNQLAGLSQKQVTACGALRHACANWQSIVTSQPATQPAVCDTLSDLCATDAAPSVDAQAWSNEFDTALAQLDDAQLGSVDAPVWRTVQCVGCNNLPRFVQLPPGLASEPPAQAWVVPQPHVPPCPVCKIKKPDTKLYLSLDPTYDTFTLLDMSVTLTDKNGVTEVLYYLPAMLPVLSSTTMQIVTDPELASVGTGAAAFEPPVRGYVRMTFNDGSTIVTAGNEIPID